MNNVTEEWRPIVGYKERYQISSFGRVKSNARTARIRGNSLRPVRERIMTLQKTKLGYWFLRLNNGQKMVNCVVHRLVAKAFLPNPNNLPIVNHLDCDKANSHVDNLEWCTYSQNTIHSLSSGNHKSIAQLVEERGLKGARAKKVSVHTLDGKLLAQYDSATKAAVSIGVNQQAISAACIKQQPCKGLMFSYSHA